MTHQDHSLVGLNNLVAASLRICAAEEMARFSLRIDPAHLTAASEAFGLELPRTIGQVAMTEEKLAVCLGPDEWYLLAPLEEALLLDKHFAALYVTVPHSLVEIGHREVGIEIEGQQAVLALQSAIPFDVEAMPVATGCRTIFDKAQIVLLRKATDQFRIDVWRSFSEHVWEILRASVGEIELDI